MKQLKWRAAANATLPAIAIGLMWPAASFAQTASSADANKTTLDEIVVTGTATRVNRQGYEAPTPTTILDAAAMEAQAQLNTVDLVNNIPSMVPTFQVGGGLSLGLNKPNFRGLGPVRTLVLIDGNRVAYTDPLGGVDLNIMPTSLLKSIEVVSGGASAGWGSDAIAGVMNFHLDTTLKGVKGNFQCGQSERGDNENCGGGIGAGTSFLDDKLHVVVAGDFVSNRGVRNASDNRSWAKKNSAYVPNHNYAPGTGQYRYNLTQDACYSTLGDGGVISGGPLRGTTFDAQGNPIPFNFGAGALPGDNMMQGGTCQGMYSRDSSSQTPALERENAYTRLTYDLTDSTSVYAEALYAHSLASIIATPNYDLFGQTIRSDNAFLPASVKAQMLTAGITTFRLGRYFPEIAPGEISSHNSLNESETEVKRYVIGGKGAIAGSWTWDAHAQYSRSAYLYRLYGDRNTANYNNATNSILNSSGKPVCANGDPACVPIDLFGPGSISQAAADYISGTATGNAYYTQTGGAVNIQGEPFAIWAGPVSLATGVETRKEKLDVTVDAIQQAGGWRVNALTNEAGDYTVTEGYLEAVVPLLKDVPGASSLDFNTAGRITNYSTSGTAKTWKLGLNYTPFESGVLRLRGTLSVDIRAPTLHELYSQQTQIASGFLFDPVFPGQGSNTPTGPQTKGGNPNLVPEEARTKVIGLVFSPNFWGLDGLTLSADYYDIQMGNGIVSLSADDTVTACYAGLASACQGVHRDPVTNQITSISSQLFNSQGLRNEGVDFQATYTKPLPIGKLTLGAMANFSNQQTTKTGVREVDGVGYRTDAMSLTGGPKWVGNVSAQYDVADWMLYLQMNYVSSILNQRNADPYYYSDNRIAAYETFNATVQRQLNENIKVFFGIDNILDKDYPYNAGPSTLPFSGVGSASYYDRIGRRFKVGARFNF